MPPRNSLLARLCLLALLLCGGAWRPAIASMAFIESQIAAHPKQTGVVVLDTGEAALLARAWLADHARADRGAVLHLEHRQHRHPGRRSLLRAAERGVKVRVIVDDLLIDAPDKSLLALAKHPNIDIRIYNPKHSVGTPFTSAP
jgi:cardiolipin synthase C